MNYLISVLLGLICVGLLALLIKMSIDLLPPKPPVYTEADRKALAKKATQILYQRDRDV